MKSKDSNGKLTEEEQQMSLEEKLDYLDREIRLLHKFCLESGYHPRQIEKSAEPFISASKLAIRKKWVRRLMIMSVVVGIFSAMVYCDPVYRFMAATGRRASMKILPFWDWTKYWDNDCIIENPLFSDVQELTESDCEVCLKLKKLPRVKNVSPDDFAEEYLKNEAPVIIEDGTKDWPEEKKMTIAKLTEIYKTHPVLKEYVGCSFKTNKKVKHGNMKIFLQQLAKSKDPGGFVAHWENCIKEGAKAFREFYKRPYFLPELVQISDTNWVFISSKHEMDEEEAEEIPMETPMAMIMQVKGEMEIALFPRPPCDEKKCGEIVEVLSEGQILVVPLSDMLWQLEYRTIPNKENVAIGIGGSFDLLPSVL